MIYIRHTHTYIYIYIYIQVTSGQLSRTWNSFISRKPELSASASLNDSRSIISSSSCESGPLRAVHLSRHKWPGA